MLATAPWVRLGVSAAALALALTDVHVTRDRAAFEAEIAIATVWRRRRTTVSELASGWARAAL